MTAEGATFPGQDTPDTAAHVCEADTTDSRPAPDEWQHSHSDGQRAGHPLAEAIQEWQVVLRCDWCYHPAGWMCHRHDPHGKRPDGDLGCPVAVMAAHHAQDALDAATARAQAAEAQRGAWERYYLDANEDRGRFLAERDRARGTAAALEAELAEARERLDIWDRA